MKKPKLYSPSGVGASKVYGGSSSRPRRKFLLLLAGLLVVVAAHAEILQTTVKYVAADAVYLDAGRLQGVQNGDQGEIKRGDSLLARIEVVFIADNSSSCKLLSSSGEVRTGDVVTLQITPLPQAAPADTAVSTQPAAPPPPRKSTKAKHSRLTGRIGVQMLSQDDRGELNHDYVEPSLSLRAQISNIAGSHHTFSVRLRSRNTDRASSNESEWTHRLYEAALHYDNPESRLHYSAGRMLSNRMSGMGYLDGLLFDYKLQPQFALGAFGGAQPDLRSYDVKTDQPKAGVFAAYERGAYDTGKLTGTLALAGHYVDGEISREFMYEQIMYSQSEFFFYQSAEVNVNRGWRKEMEGSSLALSNILLNARWTPQKWLTTTLGYDNRTNYSTYEPRTVPDSLFDDALRQGWRLGLNLRLPEKTYALVEGGWRFKEGEGQETRSGTFGAGSYDLIGSRVSLDARVNVFRSEFSEGIQPTVTIARQLLSQLRVSLQAGQNEYTISQTDEKTSNRWYRLNSDVYLSRHIYGSVYGEIYRGGGLDANRGFLELGYRF